MEKKSLKPHENLKAWQLSMDLAQKIYQVTELFPDSEKFGMGSQMRRAVVSAPSNIVEGAAMRSNSDFSRFLSYTIGSLNELSAQIELSTRTQMLSEPDGEILLNLLDETLAVTFGLRKSLK